MSPCVLLLPENNLVCKEVTGSPCCGKELNRIVLNGGQVTGGLAVLYDRNMQHEGGGMEYCFEDRVG